MSGIGNILEQCELLDWNRGVVVFRMFWSSIDNHIGTVQNIPCVVIIVIFIACFLGLSLVFTVFLRDKPIRAKYYYFSFMWEFWASLGCMWKMMEWFILLIGWWVISWLNVVSRSPSSQLLALNVALKYFSMFSCYFYFMFYYYIFYYIFECVSDVLSVACYW